MNQGQVLDIRRQKKIPSGSNFVHGMKRGTELVLTTESFEIWWIR